MPATARFAPQLLKGAAGWTHLKIGAGGYVSGLDWSSDGNTVVCRTDVGGAYVAVAPDFIWQDLCTTARLPADTTIYNGPDTNYNGMGGYGVWEIVIAPSDSNRLYMSFAGFILKSTDKGTSWTKTALAQMKMLPNDQTGSGLKSQRLMGPKMAVDPVNPDVLYVATMVNGVQRTLDGGANWTQVSAVSPNTANGGEQWAVIAIDGSSSTTSGRKSKVYFGSFNNGLYGSTDGGDTFTQLSATPTAISDMVIDTAGTVYITSVVGSALSKWSGGTLTQLIASTYNQTVAVNPSNIDHVIAMDEGAKIMTTLNATAGTPTWVERNASVNNPSSYGWDFTATDIPWLATAGMNSSCVRFRPGQANEAWASIGVGVVRATIPANRDNRLVWTSVSAGIEELVAKTGLSIPGRPPLLTCWDRPVFRISNPAAYPDKWLPAINGLSHGESIDYATDNLDYVALLSFYAGRNHNSYSLDGGRTWQLFANNPTTAQGGVIVVRNQGEVWVWPGQNQRPRYTLDNGETPWVEVTSIGGTGLPANGTENGFGFSVTFHYRQHATCDRETGDLYMWNYGPAGTPALKGIYKCAAGGVTWAKVNDGSTFGFTDTAHNKLRAVPTKAGHLLFTGGSSGGAGQANPANTNFLFSNDGGVTFNAIANAKEVQDFYCSEAGGGAYPTITFMGWYNDVYGVWVCSNFNPADRSGTWTNIGVPNAVDSFGRLVTDRNIPGRTFVGSDGRGWYEHNAA